MKIAAFCLFAALPALCVAEGLEPLDNSTLSESRVSSGLTDTERDLVEIEKIEEQQRLLPEADRPASRPGPVQLPRTDPGLTPAQQQFADSFRDAVRDYNTPD